MKGPYVIEYGTEYIIANFRQQLTRLASSPETPNNPRTLKVLIKLNIGAQIITYTILGVLYYNYSIMGPKTLFNAIP